MPARRQRAFIQLFGIPADEHACGEQSRYAVRSPYCCSISRRTDVFGADGEAIGRGDAVAGNLNAASGGGCGAGPAVEQYTSDVLFGQLPNNSRCGIVSVG